jgi:surface antigen
MHKTALPALLFVALATGFASPAHADDDRGKRRERKEVFQDGPCKVEREWKKDGDYVEERKCQGLGDRYPERKQEHSQGGCKIKREWKKNGDFKEERDCDDDGDGGGKHAHKRPPHAGRPVVVVAAPPPWVVIDKGEPVYRPGREPSPPPQRPGRVYQCESEAVGRVLGGIAGAVIGSQIGKGSDARPVATIGGAILGVLIGGEIGRQMDAGNQACIGRALEFGAVGQRVAWADGGTQYAVVPGRAVQQAGRWCRPYEAEVLMLDGWQRTRGTACRADDGSWTPRR